MFSPVRSLSAFVRGAPRSVLASAVAVTFLFAATPFLIPAIADRFAIGAGSAGLMSLVQVAAFAAANLVLPRIVQPTGRVFRLGAAGLVVGNLLTVVSPTFSLLLATRALTGVAAGALTWLGWAAAMGSARGLASMSSIGPLTALVAAPVLAWITGWGDRAGFAAIAVVAVPVMLMEAPRFEHRDHPGERSRSRSNRVLLAALFVLTMSGASLFVYMTVIATRLLGLTALQASVAFSLNATAGLVGARLSARHRRPGIWMASAGPAAVLSVVAGSPLWFYLGLTWWGFAFWMGMPGVLQMLAARSLRPDERAGDAQGIMAFGRSIGPGIGGLWVDAGSYGGLATMAGAGMVLAGLVVVGVQEGREVLPPTDPRVVG